MFLLGVTQLFNALIMLLGCFVGFFVLVWMLGLIIMAGFLSLFDR